MADTSFDGNEVEQTAVSTVRTTSELIYNHITNLDFEIAWLADITNQMTNRRSEIGEILENLQHTSDILNNGSYDADDSNQKAVIEAAGLKPNRTEAQLLIDISSDRVALSEEDQFLKEDTERLLNAHDELVVELSETMELKTIIENTGTLEEREKAEQEVLKIINESRVVDLYAQNNDDNAPESSDELIGQKNIETSSTSIAENGIDIGIAQASSFRIGLPGI